MNLKSFWLDKIDIIVTAGYAGYTGDVWIKLFSGTLWAVPIPEIANGVWKLLFASTILFVFWHKLAQWKDLK